MSELMEHFGAEDSAEFVKSLADCLDNAERILVSDTDRTVIVIDDTVARAVAEALRVVYRRNLTH